MTLTTEVNSLKKDVNSLTKEVLNHQIKASSKCLRRLVVCLLGAVLLM